VLEGVLLAFLYLASLMTLGLLTKDNSFFLENGRGKHANFMDISKVGKTNIDFI